MNRIYEVFQDSFDFVFFIYDDYRKPDSLYYGKCFPVQNKAQGIGKKIFDQSQEFGSTGKLKGIIHLTRNTAIREGPILHELMHIWANDIIRENGERQPDFLSSQESFRGLVVLVSDAPVSEFLFDRVSDDAKQFSLPGPPRRNWREWPNWWGKENIYTATHGLACMELGFLEETMRSNDPEESISMRN